MLSLKGLTGKITSQFFIIVSISIIITSIIGYVKLYEVTANNADIRVDRAARAAVSIFTLELSSEYEAVYGQSGQAVAVRLKNKTEETSLVFRQEYDDILHKIGVINQGAANLFKFNQETKAFDRFSTTFRTPDGTMPPPMSIQAGHPAYENLINNRPHVGEVPVMERMRFAYLTPIQLSNGTIAGILAVDVGWVEELTAARNELRSTMIITTILILLLVAAFGIIRMSSALKPLRELANYADNVANGINNQTVPYKNRSDEVGILAQGIDRVVELQIKLQDALNFQQLVMDNNPNIILVKDDKFRIVQANKQFLSTYTPEVRDSIIGTTGLKQYCDDDAKTCTKTDRIAFEKGYSRSVRSVTHLSGFKETHDTQKSRFEDAGGNTFILIISQDVTQRETLIEKLTDSNEELERFAHVCSHDLHEPLRMVKSFTEILELHLNDTLDVDDKTKQYMGFITNGAKRGQQLVNDVLAYSKVSKDDTAMETVDLIDVINDIKLDLPDNANLIYDAAMPPVKANKTQAYQLFQNLISNGIKYQPKDQKPEVGITWEKQGEFWQFCISDNGIGIEPRHQEKIFDVFRRLHRHQAYPGTGIGLSICKKIVERYGGLIWMESELDKGSKIFFQLPRVDEQI